VTTCQRYEEKLEALHDGELGTFARWRVERHVAGCAHCRGEIHSLRRITELLREDENDAEPVLDLWGSIAARLPEIDAELDRRAPAAKPERERRWPGLFGPIPIGVGGGLMAGAVAVSLWLRPGLPPRDDVIEELDSMGRAVAVLPSDEKSTIIWVLDPEPSESAKESGGALL
jgi:anti-sigma factor RsiW